MKAKVLVDDFRDEMGDDGTRWPAAKARRYLNAAIRAIIQLVPKAGAELRTFPLVAGVDQTIPADAVLLLDIQSNMGADGSAQGETIARVDGETLDSMNPAWRLATASDTVQEFVYAPDIAPRNFAVSPPQPGTPARVKALIAIYPADITDEVADDFPLSADYVNAAIDYMVHRAHKSETGEGSANDAALAYSTFLSSLGISAPNKAKRK